MISCPPNLLYYTNSVQSNIEYPSGVNVHSSAYNFQLNKLHYGFVFEEAESGVSKKMFRQVQLSDMSG